MTQSPLSSSLSEKGTEQKARQAPKGMGRWRERKGVRGMGRWTERTRRDRMKPERRGEREGQQGGLEGESRQRIRRRRVSMWKNPV